MHYRRSELKKMKIEFEKPIRFHLEVIETDGHVPSMRVNLQKSITGQ